MNARAELVLQHAREVDGCDYVFDNLTSTLYCVACEWSTVCPSVEQDTRFAKHECPA